VPSAARGVDLKNQKIMITLELEIFLSSADVMAAAAKE
jgi:hypothetical protein